MVVQYLATPWIQSYLCKNKIAQDAMRMLAAIFTLRSKLGVIYIDNSFEFTKACEGDRGAAGGCANATDLGISWQLCRSYHRESMQEDFFEVTQFIPHGGIVVVPVPQIQEQILEVAKNIAQVRVQQHRRADVVCERVTTDHGEIVVVIQLRANAFMIQNCDLVPQITEEIVDVITGMTGPMILRVSAFQAPRCSSTESQYFHVATKFQQAMARLEQLARWE